MPALLLVVLLSACAPAALRGQTAPVDPTADGRPSRITSVVVFPQHAEITRELVVDALPGANQVAFADLVPGLNPHTLRASTSPGARVTGTEVQTVYLEAALNAEIQALDRRLRELDDALALRAMKRGRLQERAAFYRSVKERLALDLQADLTRGRVDVGDWEAVLDFVSEGLLQCDQELAALALEVRGLETQRAAAAAERKSYAGRTPGEKRQVLVGFAADAPGEVAVRLHYIVDAATWKPSYDVHLDRAEGGLEIVAYGQILQWTGEAWDDVELTLAMSRPNFELAIPELEPMVASLDDAALAKLAKEVTFLSRSQGAEAAKWAAQRFARRQERETFRRNLEQLARQSREQLQQLGLTHAEVAGALERIADRFAAVRYPIAQRATIPPDSSPHKVVAFTTRVPVQLRYVATPALGDSVMLQGAAVNAGEHPLLAGAVSLFVDASYVGAASVDGTARNEPLAFGFGPDDALLVERRLEERDVQGPEAFRQSKVVTYHYALELRNFNDRAVDVDVVDQIPVSRTDDIQVRLIDSSDPHAFDEVDGELRWTLRVDAGATRTIRYRFSVECPVGRDVHWQ